MAPPPTTTSFDGTRSNAMAWSLDTTVWPSNFMNGSSTGAEPVATTKFLAVQLTGAEFAAPAGGVTRSVFGPVNAALPVNTVTLRAFASWPTPPTSLVTTSSLRFIMAARSISTEPSFTPCSAAWCFAQTACSLECSSALLGMQPTLRQVPPSAARFSTRATLSPSCAARNAQT